MRVVCTGAGGFIGGHLVASLLQQGHEVVAADIKQENEWYQVHQGAINFPCYDLKLDGNARTVLYNSDWIFHLACDMGGMGFLDSHRVDCLHSVDITTNVIRNAFDGGANRFFYSSSACVYPDYKQQTEIVSLAESDAWPADPEPAYGLEKLYGEELCKWYRKEKGLTTRVARFHNIYGPHGTYDGGREKAPAAICRKVIGARLFGEKGISIWGDGEQTRSFAYIDDCIHGINLLMESNFEEPLNLGSAELVTINQLVSIAEDIAGIKLIRSYDLSKPQGVRGRNSDNSLIQSLFNWQPSTSLRDGMEKTYKWIFDEMTKS